MAVLAKVTIGWIVRSSNPFDQPTVLSMGFNSKLIFILKGTNRKPSELYQCFGSSSDKPQLRDFSSLKSLMGPLECEGQMARQSPPKFCLSFPNSFYFLRVFCKMDTRWKACVSLSWAVCSVRGQSSQRCSCTGKESHLK